MKSLCLLSLLLASTVAAQTAVAEKPCIGFVAESTSPTNTYAKEPLQAAVMLSGDFEFYASGHEGCWNVHLISLPVISGKSKRIGYAISHTVTDPKGMEVGHALAFGPDRDIFVQAMHRAAADAIRNIRLARSTSHQVLPRIIEDSERKTPRGSDNRFDPASTVRTVEAMLATHSE